MAMVSSDCSTFGCGRGVQLLLEFFSRDIKLSILERNQSGEVLEVVCLKKAHVSLVKNISYYNKSTSLQKIKLNI